MVDVAALLAGSGALWAYALVAILSFGEALAFVGIFVPGSIALITAGLLAGSGVLSIWPLFIWASLGAIMGDTVSYWIGRRGFITFHSDNLLFKPALFERGEQFFQKYGAVSVFFGRFIGWIRPVVPFVAGVFALNRGVFMLWNVASGILWAVSHIALGYFFGSFLEGSSLGAWAVRIEWYGLGVLAACLGALAMWNWYRVK